MSDEQRVRYYEASIVALYHFFLIFDEECTKDISESFTSTSIEDRLAINDCIAAVITVSSGIQAVVVHMTVQDARPAESLNRWDHVSEFSLDVASGRLMVGNFAYMADSMIPLPPRTYRLRVHHGDLKAVIAAYYADDPAVTEHVWITVWPEPYAGLGILKRYPLPGARS